MQIVGQPKIQSVEIRVEIFVWKSNQIKSIDIQIRNLLLWWQVEWAKYFSFRTLCGTKWKNGMREEKCRFLLLLYCSVYCAFVSNFKWKRKFVTQTYINFPFISIKTWLRANKLTKTGVSHSITFKSERQIYYET